MKNNTYKAVSKKVAKQKSFYNHLQVFVIMMLILFFFSNTIFNFFENHIHNPNTLQWAKANIWVNALLWLIGLIIHGIYAFKDKITFLDTWEQRKINEFMNKKK